MWRPPQVDLVDPVCSRSTNTKDGDVYQSPRTTTDEEGFAKMTNMRNMVIMAMVALGTVRIMWRVLSPSRAPAFATEWAADE
jgi:hypothetical protein